MLMIQPLGGRAKSTLSLGPTLAVANTNQTGVFDLSHSKIGASQLHAQRVAAIGAINNHKYLLISVCCAHLARRHLRRLNPVLLLPISSSAPAKQAILSGNYRSFERGERVDIGQRRAELNHQSSIRVQEVF